MLYQFLTSKQIRKDFIEWFDKWKKAPILCKFGIHNWFYTTTIVNYNKETERECKRCKKVQWLDIHCLGFRPPTYIETWFNKE